jgi:hypothetical protein
MHNDLAPFAPAALMASVRLFFGQQLPKALEAAPQPRRKYAG